MWVYESPVGLMKISRISNGQYGLWISSNMYGCYSSAESAADDVFTCSTGCYEWDSLAMCNPGLIPTDLSDWEEY